MFERLMERARKAAERRAAGQVLELTERMRAEAPGGVRIEAGEGGVVLSGRGLRRRFAVEPALRWLRHG